MCVLRVHLPSQLGSQSTTSRSQPDRPPMLRLAPPGVESNKPPLRRRCRHTAAAAVPAPAPLSEKSQTECHVTKLAKESLCQATSPHLPACSSPPLPHRHEKVHLFQTRMQSLKKSFCYTIDLSSCAAVKAEVEPNSDSYHGACLMLPCRSPTACPDQKLPAIYTWAAYPLVAVATTHHLGRRGHAAAAAVGPTFATLSAAAAT